MGLFTWLKRAPRQEEPPEEWWQALSRIEHDMQQLQLAWEETFGKVRRALATLAKRQQRGEEDAPEPPATDARVNHMHSVGERLRAARARYGRS